MSRFVSSAKRTAQYANAVRALEKLIEEEGLDKAERAAAEVFSSARRDYYLKGYKESTGAVCLSRIIRGGGSCRCFSEYYENLNLPHSAPGSDHVTILLEKGRPAVYHSQPYSLSFSEAQELVDMCRNYNLEFKIDAHSSWWFPGHTISIWITRKGAKE